jgi:Nuclease-related domain
MTDVVMKRWARDAALVDAGITQAGPAPESSAAHPEPQQWHDLADNRAGASVRGQAQQARAEAPIKTILARLFGVHTQERAWRLGADGEEAVAKRLSKLDDRWRVLHAVPVGSRDSDIDHVVIGPGGVYTINAKNHPGARIWVGGDGFRVNGRRVPYIRNSRHEALRASRLLSEAAGFPVFVTGLLAVYGASDFTVKQQPATDVVVLTRRETVKWLSRRPETLTVEQADAIYEHARRSTTWSTNRKASA